MDSNVIVPQIFTFSTGGRNVNVPALVCTCSVGGVNELDGVAVILNTNDVTCAIRYNGTALTSL
jgi:hypothetical protein